ncbi:hypothetical protein SAMN03159304_01126 [Pseudomonas sp. NFACC24-1]|uniref:hypothetical protein n=1 Tax=Pseudomonas sp. NFACC24-1 TaxID=1566189 RepID=UPI0008EDDAA1|nr:hypothetical protein [Pseudomonas sp. NFACC24-1]SFN83444.1 hypothetical protein SAMN03159304_01126 [Pseudomonas sp. NFACC24-1]
MSQIKERPILFSAPMVRAILEDRKTVTRRAVKIQPHIDASGNFCVGNSNYGQDGYGKPVTKHFVNECCPYGKPGDRLWVREAWVADAQLDSVAPRELSQGEPIRYPADEAVRQTGCAMISPGKTRPSIHMPRWVSRILLEIIDVRVERLQDIRDAQALAEGIIGVDFRPDDGWPICTGYMVGPDDGESPLETTAARAFARLWSSINGADSFAANPWVWVVEFKRVQP